MYTCLVLSPQKTGFAHFCIASKTFRTCFKKGSSGQKKCIYTMGSTATSNLSSKLLPVINLSFYQPSLWKGGIWFCTHISSSLAVQLHDFPREACFKYYVEFIDPINHLMTAVSGDYLHLSPELDLEIVRPHMKIFCLSLSPQLSEQKRCFQHSYALHVWRYWSGIFVLQVFEASATQGNAWHHWNTPQNVYSRAGLGVCGAHNRNSLGLTIGVSSISVTHLKLGWAGPLQSKVWDPMS